MSDSPPFRSDARLAVGTHLVGSVPLADGEQVLRWVSRALGSWLRRIPDGETGPRADWIIWQLSCAALATGIRGVSSWSRSLPRVAAVAIVRGRMRDGYRLRATRRRSPAYRVFATLERDGIVPGH
jgi:hypothetical protein